MKHQRHAKILKLIADYNLNTQEQIIEMLRNEGFDATQATVSRDIKELGLIKLATSDGNYKYVQTKASNVGSSAKYLIILNQSIITMDFAMHTIVLKTHAGMAQAAGAAIDHLVGNEILGSIGGDDTLLLICHSEEHAKNIVSRLNSFLKMDGE
jgi:Arginine repressor